MSSLNTTSRLNLEVNELVTKVIGSGFETSLWQVGCEIKKVTNELSGRISPSQHLVHLALYTIIATHEWVPIPAKACIHISDFKYMYILHGNIGVISHKGKS